ncbi:MAG TPA: ParB-like protein, partial [Xanthobacteraceae bacterium]|nr:ParB-like protein [Xanthobacteraceae bacterium]
MTVREPILVPVTIAELRPTQITVGLREVMEKRKKWRETGNKKSGKFLGEHMIPVILGPKKRHYVIDHHHLARALHDEGVKEVAVTVVADLSRLD